MLSRRSFVLALPALVPAVPVIAAVTPGGPANDECGSCPRWTMIAARPVEATARRLMLQVPVPSSQIDFVRVTMRGQGLWVYEAGFWSSRSMGRRQAVGRRVLPGGSTPDFDMRGIPKALRFISLDVAPTPLDDAPCAVELWGLCRGAQA